MVTKALPWSAKVTASPWCSGGGLRLRGGRWSAAATDSSGLRSKANTDEYEGVAPFGPIQGMTLRLFDPASRQWRLYWANSATGILDRPVVGSFRNGRGEFYNEDTHEGRSIYTRYIWSEITESSCRWEQAFSVDGGKSWETNWIMEFTRER